MTNVNFDEPSVGTVTANGKAALEVKNNGTRKAVGIIGESTGTGKGVYGKGGELATGVYGEGKFSFGVLGESTGSSGVLGNGIGVTGVMGQSDKGLAVFGNAFENAGVYGKSRDWVGVIGVSDSNAGVWGIGHSKNMAGVWGNSNNGAGVYGKSNSWIGVHGISDTSAGVLGKSNSWAGVHGTSTKIGILGTAPIAGRFEGDVEVTGDISLTNGDCAEDFDIAESELKCVETGTVMVLNKKGSLQPSNQEYDKKVAGVISGARGYKPAIVLDRQPSQNNHHRAPVALIGKVYCKVDARHSSIEIGDLLTTSSTKGHAMKAEDAGKAFGAVIGKALGSIKGGLGMIPVLIALQ
jgi:hypothetical protein